MQVGIEEPPAIGHEGPSFLVMLQVIYAQLFEVGKIRSAMNQMHAVLKRNMKARQMRGSDNTAANCKVIDQPESEWAKAWKIDADFCARNLSQEGTIADRGLSSEKAKAELARRVSMAFRRTSNDRPKRPWTS